MVRKCSVYGCRTGYRNESKDQKVTVYRFPTKDKERLRSWIASLPNKLNIEEVTEFMGVCALHWPTNTPMERNSGRYFVPALPPSIFPNVPPSCVPSAQSCSTPRPTKKATQQARAIDIDEMSSFRELDSFKLDTFHETFVSKLQVHGLVASTTDQAQYVLISLQRNGPVPDFSIYFNRHAESGGMSLKFEAYRALKRIHHTFINTIQFWSELDEILRFVVQGEELVDKKMDFLMRNVRLQNAPKNTRVYSADDLLLAFTWYAKSRALYLTLREHLQLPSVSTLKKITSMSNNIDDESVFKSLFAKMDDKSNYCVLIIDEVYVKASISYRGGTVFGYAVDVPGKVATTLLCIMVKCFFGSKSFLIKLLPCHALKAAFQFQKVRDVILDLERWGTSVVAIICDNNRVNQSFFGMFPKMNLQAPWIAQSSTDNTRPLFLIYDPVHIMKNLRNNWITEKTKAIDFYPKTSGTPKTAKWSDLQELFDHESKTLVKLSDLTKAAINPSNIQKQKVSLALKVFSEKTSAALKTCTAATSSWKDTANFIDVVLSLWKVFNTKTPVQHIRLRDPVRTPVSSTENQQVEILKFWADSATLMKPSSKQRIRSLTKDTANAVSWTCKCLVDLCHFLLNTNTPLHHQYVAIGFFQQDDIERHFAHFRMSAGSNYYITAQDVAHTHAIDRTKLVLESVSERDYSKSQHMCDLCDKELTDAELLILDDIPESASSVSTDERMSLFYIGGYLVSKHPELKEDTLVIDEEVRKFTQSLNRGGLSYPNEALFQLLLYCYTFFTGTKESCCRKRLVKIFGDFTAIFHIRVDVSSVLIMRIVNIFMKRFCLQIQATTSDETQRKVAKLSSQ